MKILSLFCLLLFIGTGFSGFAQCDSTATLAQGYMETPFIGDGQDYRALIFGDQVAEFRSTFYANAEYRIVAVAGSAAQQLIFSLYDTENNLLFTNADHANAPYWNFSFNSTMTCKIEATLDNTKQNSGCAVLLIGFER